MSEKHKIVCRVFVLFLFLLLVVVSISACVSLVGVPLDIASSAAGLKFFSWTAGIKNY